MFSNERSIQVILDLTKDDVIFKDQYNKSYCAIKNKNHYEVFSINSDKFKDRIRLLHFKKFKRPILESSLKQIIDTYYCLALESKSFSLEIRVIKYMNDFYYDLINNEYQMVKIGDNDWRVIPQKKILFRRNNENKAQCIPSKGGDIKKLLQYVRIKESEQFIFLISVISCFIPEIQHPLFLFYGESGNGKSTTSRIIQELIDPSVFGIITKPLSEEDLMLALDKHWFLAIDNISNLNTKMSNCLSCAVTGAAMSRRKFYSDDKNTVLEIKKCILLNGLSIFAKKEDLIQRSLIFEIIGNKVNKPANELLSSFENDKPYILGAIFDIIVKAKNMYGKKEFVNDFRMAEFAAWGFAIAEAIGNKGEDFLADLRRSIKKQISISISSNSFATALKFFLEKRNEWVGRPSDLLEELLLIAHNEKLDTKSESWPKDSMDVTKNLNAITNLLKNDGIKYKHLGRNNYGAKILLQKIE